MITNQYFLEKRRKALDLVCNGIIHYLALWNHLCPLLPDAFPRRSESHVEICLPGSHPGCHHPQRSKGRPSKLFELPVRRFHWLKAFGAGSNESLGGMAR